MGTLTFDEAYEIIKKQVLLAKDKVDAVLFETMTPKEQLTPKISTFKPSKTLTIVIGSHPDNVLKLLSMLWYNSRIYCCFEKKSS